jgi:hypothetical protein
MPSRGNDPNPALLALDDDELIDVHTRALDANLVLTNKRLVVTTDAKVVVDVPIEMVRRIQFDIEKARPATFVVVPEWPSNPPQSLAIPPEEYDTVAKLLTHIGTRLNAMG